MKLGDFAEKLARDVNSALGSKWATIPWEVVRQRAIRGSWAATTAQAQWKARVPSDNRRIAVKDIGIENEKEIATAMENAIKKMGGKHMTYKNPETGYREEGYRVGSVFIEKVQDFAYNFYTWKKAKTAFKLGESKTVNKTKLTDLLEGKFGPGSPTNAIRIQDKGWKANLGAIENKRRPESLYITLSTWAVPNVTLATSMSLGAATPDEVVATSARQLESELKRIQPQIRAFFDSLYFQPDSVIFTYEFKAGAAKPGKSVYLEIEINVDTVNVIDSDENPAPNPKTGKIEMLHLDAFKDPVQKAVEKIVSLPVFSRSKDWNFQKTKRG